MMVNTNVMEVMKNNVKSQEMNIDNLLSVVENIKEMFVNNKFDINWNNNHNIFQNETLNIYLYTITTINSISDYLNVTSCQTDDFIGRCYTTLDEIFDLWTNKL